MARNTPTWDDVRDAFREHKVVVIKYLGLLHEIAASRTPMEWDAVNPLLERMQSSGARWMDCTNDGNGRSRKAERRVSWLIRVQASAMLLSVRAVNKWVQPIVEGPPRLS